MPLFYVSSGKTYTMEGARTASKNGQPKVDDDSEGIMPRAFEQIWMHINSSENMKFVVTASYLEIYMEDTHPNR